MKFEPGKGYWIYVSNAAQLTVPAPTDHEYEYDSQGRRLASVVIYDGENQIAKYDDLGNLLVSYFQGPGIDNPISMTRDGQTYCYHTDALGSVTELTDAGGNIVQSYRYDAFGSIVQQSGSIKNAFTYTGREYDANTGLYYYRARYYDAETGRFLSRDPVYSANLYVYVVNNPLMLIEPMGLWCSWFGWDTERSAVILGDWGPWNLYAIAGYPGFGFCLYKRSRHGSQEKKTRPRYLCYDRRQGFHYDYGVATAVRPKQYGYRTWTIQRRKLTLESWVFGAPRLYGLLFYRE